MVSNKMPGVSIFFKLSDYSRRTVSFARIRKDDDWRNF